MNLEKLLKYKSGKTVFFEVLSQYPKNWQCNTTPFVVVNSMINKVNTNNRKILILFNIEFIDCLLDNGISPSNIYYIADNHLELLVAEKIYKVNSKKCDVANKVNGLIDVIEKFDMKFDIVFSNPPYNDGIDLNIIESVIPFTDEMVVVHPSSWLMDRKNKYKPFTKFKKIIENKVKSFEIFNGNPVFGIALPLPVLISHFTKHSEYCDVKYTDLNENFSIKCDELDSITKFGKRWSTHVKPFFDKIMAHSEFLSAYENQPQYGELVCEFQWAVGGPVKGLKKDKASLYSMAFQNSDKNLVNKDEIGKDRIQFYFKTEEERLNFFNYVKTDFARFCLVLYKNDRSLKNGPLTTVPWLDFTQEWNDDKLFKKFDISVEIQNYIREYLPDYHSIRK